MGDFLASFTQMNFGGESISMWAFFFLIVIVLMVLDLGVLNKDNHEIGFKQSIRLSLFYILFGVLFGGWIFLQHGSDSALDYYTAYTLEKTLSMDNLFVMSVIFSSFAIPKEYQHRVLFWGILGVLILRGIMIISGAILIHQFSWVLYIFAGILILTAVKMLTMKDDDDAIDFSEKPLIRFLKTHMRFTPAVYGKKFFVKIKLTADNEKNVWVATPLFLALIVIELTDVMFAFDSVPAALAVTTDIYIVFTSNIFAILGLRALYFAVDHILARLTYMKYALAIVLLFIGFKVFYNGFVGHIHPGLSLFITLGVLAIGAVISVYKTKDIKLEKHD